MEGKKTQIEGHNYCLPMVLGCPYKRQIRPVLQDLSRQNFNLRAEFQLFSCRYKRNCLKIDMTALGSTELLVLNSIQVDIG